MKGIYGNEILMKQFGILLFVSGVLLAVYMVFDPETMNVKNEGNTERENGLFKSRRIIQLIIMLSVLFLLVIGGLYLTISYKLKIVSICILIIGCMFCGIAFFVSIIEFIQYIFLKPFEYQLTREKENTLWLIGLLAYVVCYTLTEDDIGKLFNQEMSLMTVYWSDIIQMVVLMFWYFSVIFFSLIFLIVSAHKVIMIIRSKLRPKRKFVKKSDTKVHNKSKSELSEKVLGKIGNIPKGKRIERIGVNFFWVFCVILDTLKLIFEAMFDMIQKIVLATLLILPMTIGRGIKKILIILEKNQGKGVTLSSRISLVSSILIVYLVDKYQNVFSKTGSDVYEFFCSVLIIPFLITQLNELHKKIDA
jgi:hypothetical protein